MRILLVHNIGAGDVVHNREWLEGLVRQHGHDVEYCAAADDWKSAADASVDLIVAAGGDGTVAEVARHVAGSHIPIGVLPLGTANNVASALGVASRSIPELVASWTHAERRPFDTGHATGPKAGFRFIESVGIGLLAESIAAIDHGHAAYVDQLSAADDRMDAAVDVLRHTLRELAPVHAELELDGRRMSGDYLLVEVMNFGSAGPNLSLVPDADSADGLFDVVLVDDRHRTSLMDDLPRYRSGQRPAAPLPVCRASHVILTCDGCRVHLDDRVRAADGRMELAVEPHSLTFLV